MPGQIGLDVGVGDDLADVVDTRGGGGGVEVAIGQQAVFEHRAGRVWSPHEAPIDGADRTGGPCACRPPAPSLCETPMLDLDALGAQLAHLHTAFWRYRDAYHDDTEYRAKPTDPKGVVRVSRNPHEPRHTPLVLCHNTDEKEGLSAHQQVEKKALAQALLTHLGAISALFNSVPLFNHPHQWIRVAFHEPARALPVLEITVDGFGMHHTKVQLPTLLRHIAARIERLARIPADGPFQPFLISDTCVWAPRADLALAKHVLLRTPNATPDSDHVRYAPRVSLLLDADQTRAELRDLIAHTLPSEAP